MASNDPSSLIHHEVTREVLGVFFDLHTRLGDGVLENVYANGMALLLRRLGLRVHRERAFDIVLEGESIGRYRPDLVVEFKGIVEVKAGQFIDPAHLAQTRNYMRASGISVGLVCNFGVSAEFKRLIRTNGRIGLTS